MLLNIQLNMFKFFFEKKVTIFSIKLKLYNLSFVITLYYQKRNINEFCAVQLTEEKKYNVILITFCYIYMN